MKVRIDYGDLLREQTASQSRAEKIKTASKNRVKIVSLRVLGRVKVVMPVDKGAARTRWGIQGASGGIWQELDEGMTIIQGARLDPYEYIAKLNEGSSQQAPAGFLDAIAYKAEQEFIQELLSDLGNIL